MLEKTISGIAQAIQKQYGNDYPVHIGAGTQKRAGPCFEVIPLRQSREKSMGSCYKLQQSFEIRYYPLKEEGILECAGMLSGLYDLLEYIALGENLLRGTGMAAEIKEGALCFHVDYNLEAAKVMVKEDAMEVVDAGIRKG